jgi:hypothetical protein
VHKFVQARVKLPRSVLARQAEYAAETMQQLEQEARTRGAGGKRVRQPKPSVVGSGRKRRPAKARRRDIAARNTAG